MLPNYLSPEEMLRRLTHETPEDQQQVAILLQAVRKATSEDFQKYVAPASDALLPEQKDEFTKAYGRISQTEFAVAREAAIRAKLEDLDSIRNLTQDELKALTIGVLYYIAFEDQRHEQYDARTFLSKSGVEMTPRLRGVLGLLNVYYFHSRLQRSAEGVPLFKIDAVYEKIAAFVRSPTQDGFAVTRDLIKGYEYSSRELKRITKEFRVQLESNIKAVYDVMERDLQTRVTVARAWFRMGSRFAALALIFMLCRGITFNFESWFRKTSKDYAKEQIVQVYTQHAAEVARLTQEKFVGMSPQRFNEEKQLLEYALKELTGQHIQAIDNINTVVVGDERDAIEAIKKAFKDERLMFTVRQIANETIEEVQRSQGFRDFLSRLFNSDTISFKKDKIEELQRVERDIENRIESLFGNEDFRLALDKDRKGGIIEVQVANGLADYFAKQGAVWITDAGKASAKFVIVNTVKMALIAAKSAVTNIFNYAKGYLTNDTDLQDKAKQSLLILVLFALTLYGLCRVIYWYFKPILFWIPPTVKFGVWFMKEYGVKTPVIAYRFIVAGVERNFHIITGNITLDELATERPMKSERMTVQTEGRVKHLLNKARGRDL
jgi:hypothetical protein